MLDPQVGKSVVGSRASATVRELLGCNCSPVCGGPTHGLVHACLVTSVVSDSLPSHGPRPARLLCPRDSPGKNTGVGCHFLLQCMKVKSEREVPQSCPTLHDPMDRSLSGSSLHGIFQARVLEWGAITFSDGLIAIIVYNT